MMVVLCIFSLLFVVVTCVPHTPTERETISNICGKFPDAPQSVKSIGGRPAEPEEAPWVVSLRFNSKST